MKYFFSFCIIYLSLQINALARSISISGESYIVSPSRTVLDPHTSEMLEYGAYIVIILVIFSMIEPIKKYLGK